jgi:hypothetical protein
MSGRLGGQDAGSAASSPGTTAEVLRLARGREAGLGRATSLLPPGSATRDRCPGRPSRPRPRSVTDGEASDGRAGIWTPHADECRGLGVARIRSPGSDSYPGRAGRESAGRPVSEVLSVTPEFVVRSRRSYFRGPGIPARLTWLMIFQFFAFSVTRRSWPALGCHQLRVRGAGEPTGEEGGAAWRSQNQPGNTGP